MKHTKQEENRIVTEPAAREQEAGVDTLLASFPVKPSISVPRDMRRGLIMVCAVLALTLILGTVLLAFGGSSFWTRRPPSTHETGEEADSVAKPVGGDPTASYPYADGKSGDVLLAMPESVSLVEASLLGSTHAVVADATNGTVLASRLGNETMFPASMTKVMTLIVAVERLREEGSLQDTLTITKEVNDRMIAEGASRFGFEPGTQLSVEALLYVLILKSDGVAACELANYIAGSEAAFVELMNEKAASMGLAGTHFENATGLHHPRHVSTARDMASIMAYAMQMKLCRTILTAEVFRTNGVLANGEPIAYAFYNALLVHQFEKVEPHHPTGLRVVAGKTGYTPESGSCLVTYAEAPDGRAYVCVTANAQNYAGCIADYIALYQAYARP